MRGNDLNKKKFSIRSGDQVEVISGGNRGKKGKVLSVLRDSDRILIEGVNKVKRHVKPTQSNPQGGIVEKELPIHISNVMLLDPKTNKRTRVGKKLEKDGWVRVSRKSGTVIVAQKVTAAAASKNQKAETNKAKAAKA